MTRGALEIRTPIRVIIEIPTLTIYLRGHRTHASSFPPEAWPNGMGITRTLARGDHWRVSLAEVSDGAAFSVLPGIDRLFVPLLPDAIALRAGAPLSAEPSGALRFRGDEPISASVPDGLALAVNLMVDDRRLQMRAHRYPGWLEAAITFRGR